jgi:hypothetical protein
MYVSWTTSSASLSSRRTLRDPVKPSVVSLHDQTKGGLVPMLRQFDQRHIIEIVQP